MSNGGWMLAATIVIAIATVVYAIVAVFQLFVYRQQAQVAKQQANIADQQRRLAEDSSRIALYERRLAVFKALARFMANAVANYNVSNQELRDLLQGTAEVEFLFNREIAQYVREVYSKGNDLHTAIFKLGPEDSYPAEISPISRESRMDLVEEGRAAMDWFVRELETAKEKFRPYLDFGHI